MKIILFLLLNNIISLKLNNGLQVFLLKNDIVPLVAVEIAFRAGSNYENEMTNGLFHLYEHMLFKGNRKYKTQEKFRERVRELGIIWNGSTSTERVQYYYVCPKENLYSAMELLKETIVYPLFNPDELKKEKNVVLDEYKRDFSYPLERFYHEIEREFYAKDFVRKNVIGDENAIKNATALIMKQIKDKFYNPENAFLVICGDIDFKETEEMVKKIWSDWENKKEKPELPKVETIKKNKLLRIKDAHVQNAYMEVLLRGPETDEERKDTYVADLFAEVLNSENSFFKKFFIENRLATEARCGYYTQKYGGEIYFYFETEKGKIDTLKEKFEKFIKNIDNPENYTEKLIKKAKNKIEIEYEKEKEPPLDYALSFSFFLCTADFEYYENYIKEIEKIGKEDLIKFARKYIKKNPMLIGILEPEK